MRGSVQRISQGKRQPSNLYVMLKNGSVWKHIDPVTDEGVNEIMLQLKRAGFRLDLKGWKRVRKA